MSINDFRELLTGSEATKQAYTRTLKMLKKYNSDLTDLDLQDIRQFVIDQRRKNKPATVRRHWSAIKAYIETFVDVFGYEFYSSLKLLERRLIPTIDAADWRERMKKVILSRDEVEQVIQSVDTRYPEKHKAMLQLGYDCALRVGELLSLQVKNLQLEQEQIMFTPEKKKSSEQYTVSFYMENTSPFLKTYLESVDYLQDGELKGKDGEYLFFGRRKVGTGTSGYRLVEDKTSPLRRKPFINTFKRIIQKAGFPNKASIMRFHDFARHSRATNLMRKHLNIFIPHYRLRHENLKTTKKYLHILSDDIARKIRENLQQKREERDIRRNRK